MMKRLGIVRWKLDFVKIFMNRSLSVTDEILKRLKRITLKKNGMRMEMRNTRMQQMFCFSIKKSFAELL